ncbi:MAG: tetratricopeptide repeat protein [Ignavibacteria bacterium]|nr:tetratricopeptide repeat protein [Ignavibacteria bacterium]
MKKVNLIIVLVLLFVATIYSQSVQDLIKKCDEYIEEKFDNVNALKTIEQAYKLDPNNFEVLWRMSRAYVDYAEHLPSKTDQEKEQQLKMYEKAVEFAEKAIKVNPNSSIGYIRRAIANGRVALFKGVFQSISLVNSVKADCEKAIQLNNGGDIQQSVALYVLARAHSKVCERPKFARSIIGLGWGDREEAAKLFERAIKMRPNFIMYRLEAAKNYIAMENFQKAKEHLYAIQNLPKLDEDDDEYRAEARKLLNEIKNK